MFDNSKSRNNRVLRSESYLTSNFDPAKPVRREQELDKIVEALQPLVQKRPPENLLIYGPSGVGKTTCVKHVFEKLRDRTRVKPVFINCWQYNTRSSLLTELLIELGYPAPRKGKPVDELLAKLREWLDKNRGVAVALDEFDQLKQNAEVIYDLQLLNEEAENKLGLVMVSNQHPSRLELDPRSQSRLSLQTLEFNQYSAKQLLEILEQRVEQAFHPGSIEGDVLEKIAEKVAEESGDCREAFELLLRVGREAEQRGESKITETILERVVE